MVGRVTTAEHAARTLAGTYGPASRRGRSSGTALPVFGGLGTATTRAARRALHGLRRPKPHDAPPAEVASVEALREEHRKFLHGGVLQTLEALSAPDLDQDRLDLIRRQARRDVHRIRAYLDGHDLRPDGLEGVVEALVEEAADRGLDLVVVRGDVPVTSGTLDPKALSAVHVAASEAIANVAKHAGVGSATLRLTSARSGLELSVADSGLGFDPADSDHRRGFGLRHAIAAVDKVGGNTVVDGVPDGGTLVCLWVPLADGLDRSA
ncbi:MAG: sensor histidine kinase [Streptosporangiaceae bacterium]